MGLDVSHDAWDGVYSAFNRFRQVVARAMGGSFPPHPPQLDESLEDGIWYWGEGYTRATHPGLHEFFAHSDCDGFISPEMCRHVADELEALLPAIEATASPNEEWGHIARVGGMVAVTRRFIAGCRRAAEAGEPLEFY